MRIPPRNVRVETNTGGSLVRVLALGSTRDATFIWRSISSFSHLLRFASPSAMCAPIRGFLVNKWIGNCNKFCKANDLASDRELQRLLNADIPGSLVLNLASQCLRLGVPGTTRSLRMTRPKKTRRIEHIPATRPPTSGIRCWKSRRLHSATPCLVVVHVIVLEWFSYKVNE